MMKTNEKMRGNEGSIPDATMDENGVFVGLGVQLAKTDENVLKQFSNETETHRTDSC